MMAWNAKSSPDCIPEARRKLGEDGPPDSRQIHKRAWEPETEQNRNDPAIRRCYSFTGQRNM